MPSALGQLPFDRNTNVTALIYEFQVPEKDRKPVVSSPSELPGVTHLRKSKIINYLKN
ncbi:MAG: hypothetical protein IPJ82_16495 [Lewinellaceae bacterium]|nr:hypothetical protein [Lewinellaceae bacterium]